MASCRQSISSGLSVRRIALRRTLFEGLAGALDLEVLDQDHGVAISQHVAGGIADLGGLGGGGLHSEAGRHSPVTSS